MILGPVLQTSHVGLKEEVYTQIFRFTQLYTLAHDCWLEQIYETINKNDHFCLEQNRLRIPISSWPRVEVIDGGGTRTAHALTVDAAGDWFRHPTTVFRSSSFDSGDHPIPGITQVTRLGRARTTTMRD